MAVAKGEHLPPAVRIADGALTGFLTKGPFDGKALGHTDAAYQVQRPSGAVQRKKYLPGGGQVADRHPQLVFNGAQFFGHFKFVGNIGEHPPQRFAIERNICHVGDALQPLKGAAADAAVRHVKSTPAFGEAHGKVGIGNFPFVPRAFGGTIVPNFIQ